MHVDVFRRIESLHRLKENWDLVYDADPEANFFLSWTWLSGWLTEEKPQWQIFAIKEDADAASYFAFFPVRFRLNHAEDGEVITEMAMAGNRCADYAGFICLPELEKYAAACYAKVLTELKWDAFHLENIFLSSTRNKLLLSLMSKSCKVLQKNHRDSFEPIDNARCPYVSLPDSWESYLMECLASNTRRKARRYLEKLDTAEDYRLDQTTADDFEKNLAILLELWTKKWGAKKGDNLGSILKKLEKVLSHACATNTLLMPVLYHQDQPIGVIACFLDDNKKTMSMFCMARDETHKNPPPGLLLNFYCIRKAIEMGCRTYDFLRGNEPYKYMFGVQERRIGHYIVMRSGQKPPLSIPTRQPHRLETPIPVDA